MPIEADWVNNYTATSLLKQRPHTVRGERTQLTLSRGPPGVGNCDNQLTCYSIQGHEWWSGYSMNPRTVFDLLICVDSFWSIGDSCMIVQCITSQPANTFSNAFYWHFRRSPPVGWNEKVALFNTLPAPCLEVKGTDDMRSGMGLFNSPMGSY